MPETIFADSYTPSNLGEKSFLTLDASSGQPDITVDNSNNFIANDFVLLSVQGTENSEIKQILSVAGDVITFTTNLENDYLEGEFVTELNANQIKFYRASNVDGNYPADAGYSLIGTVTIESDNLETQFIDNTGGSDYWYKYTYYNSSSTNESAISTSAARRGGNFGHYCTVDDIIREAGFGGNIHIPASVVADTREDAESEVQGSLTVAGYQLPLTFVPPVIRNITKRLAAGYLLLQDYGVEAENSTKEGNAKIDLANKLLEKIQSREMQLVGVTQVPVDVDDSIGGTSISASNNNEPKIRMQEKW